MALLQDLIKQIDDETLRQRIMVEVNKLSKQKKFGLVFEEHLPECTPLYDVEIRRNSKVALKTGQVSDIYIVCSIDGDMATCEHKTDHAEAEFALDDLVVVAEFGEPIYPYLKPIDTVCNAPDSDLWHTLIEADNYHALQLLEYLYAGKVDCIYIDPAAGSGNFLTETYLSLRRLENEVLKELSHGQITFGYEDFSPIQVSISQFYGIEINDFAVTVAKTALWIAEDQMMKETEEIVLMQLDFLPLKSYANIVEGNALRLDWESVVPKSKLNYIMGNPPFVGNNNQSDTQRADMLAILGGKGKTLDYVAGWYFKAASYINGTKIRVSFVSTNSITQGEQVAGI